MGRRQNSWLKPNGTWNNHLVFNIQSKKEQTYNQCCCDGRTSILPDETPQNLTLISKFSFLLLALQPTVSFSLLSDSLLFCSLFALLSLPSYSHYLHNFFNVYNPSLPWSSSNSRTYLSDVLLSSIRITWPIQSILPLFINLTLSAFSISLFSS